MGRKSAERTRILLLLFFLSLNVLVDTVNGNILVFHAYFNFNSMMADGVKRVSMIIIEYNTK